MSLRRTAPFVAIVLAISLFSAGKASAQIQDTIGDVEQPVGSSGRVDWTTGVITAVGVGTPPAQTANSAQARSGAERAAQAAAYRNMLEAVKTVQVDSINKVEHFISDSNLIRSDVNGIIQGAMIMDKKYMPDGSVEVTVGMNLTGAFSDALLPKTTPTPATGLTGTVTASPEHVYTGLIVDARGLGINPALAPKILNEEGREVYSMAWIDRDYAVREGMVSYLQDPGQAKTSLRVTDKPFMIKALKAADDSRVDIVISNADAAMLESASENLKMLKKCKVIILVD